MLDRLSEMIGNSKLKVGKKFSRDGIKYRILETHTGPEFFEAEVYGCSKGITEARIPQYIDNIKITSICSQAFKGCVFLRTIKISEGILTIGDSAFSDCSSLTWVNIPKSVTLIESNAFRYKFFNSNKDELTKSEDIAGNSYLLKNGCYIMCSKKDEYDKKITQCKNSDTIESEGFTYKITSLISNEVEIAKYSGNISELYIPTSVNGFKITAIGQNSFQGCHSLTAVNVPESVTKIRGSAFSNCSSLSLVNIPESVKSISESTFYGCSSLRSISISKNVTEIGEWAFKNCNSLESINIPENVNKIGEWAFSGCSSLKSMNICNGIKIISRSTFYGCRALASVNIPDGVKTIGSYAFFDCGSLTLVNIPKSVTTIEFHAFDYKFFNSNSDELTRSEDIAGHSYILKNGCYIMCLNENEQNKKTASYAVNDITESDKLSFEITSLLPKEVKIIKYSGNVSELNIPASINGFKIKAIGHDAFKACNSLISVNIPDSVTVIEDNAFCDCISLTSINIPNGVKKIGEGTFSGCSSLTSINIPNGVKEIGVCAFICCSSLTSVNMPESVTEIGRLAFSECSSLTSINIPNGVKTIIECTFLGCSSLTSVNIPESVNKINMWVFSDCSSLTSINIPKSVKIIESHAFDYKFFNSNNNELTRSEDIAGHSYTLKNGSYVMDAETSEENPIQKEISNSVGSKIESDRFLFEIKSSEPAEVVLTGYNGSSEDVTIPSSIEGFTVVSIGIDAFRGCSSLTSVTIPEGVISICDDAFHRCSNLRHVCIPSTVTDLSKYAFDLRFLKPNSKNPMPLSKIPGHTYTLDTEEGVFRIADSNPIDHESEPHSSVFESDGFRFRLYTETDGSVYAEISDYIDTAGEVVIPSSVKGCKVTSIGRFAFRNCTHVSRISLGDYIRYIHTGAFSGCSSLFAITLSESLESIDDWAFFRCEELGCITIPDSVGHIGNGAFYGCVSLVSAELPEELQSIENCTFYGCLNLTNIDMPKAANIGKCAFYGCRSLSGIMLPDCVEYIGIEAFSGCSQVKTIRLPRMPFTIDFQAFDFEFYDERGNTLPWSDSSGHEFIWNRKKNKFLIQQR